MPDAMNRKIYLNNKSYMPFFCINVDCVDNIRIYIIDNDIITYRNVRAFNVRENSYEVLYYCGNGSIVERDNIEDVLVMIAHGWVNDSFYFNKYNGIFVSQNFISWISNGIVHNIIDDTNSSGLKFIINEFPPKCVIVIHDDINMFDVTTNEMFTTWLRANYNY